MRIEREKLNRWLCCFLVLMMPFSWVNIAIGSVYRLVIVAVFAVYLINNRFQIAVAKENLTVFVLWTAYTGYAVLTTLWSQSMDYSVNNSLGMVLLYLMSLSFLTVSYDKDSRRLLEICWLIGTIFLALLFLFGETMKLGYLERRTLIILGTPTDANEFASFFIIGFCVILNMFLKERRKIVKALLIVAAMVVVYVVMMAASRGALLSLIVAATVTLFVALKNVSVWKVIGFVLVGILAAILIGLLVLPMIPRANLERLMFNAIIEDAGSGRSSIWSSAWDTFINGDAWRLLIGYGYGRFGVETEFGDANMMMHNQFLQQLISYGLIGLVLYVMLIWQCFLVFRKRTREYFGAFIGITVMSLTLTMGPSYKILWIVLFIALMQCAETEEEPTPTLQRG